MHSYINSAAGASTLPLFERLPAEKTGLSLIHQFPNEASLEALQDQRSGAGVCLGDYDADGWPDIYVSNYDRGNRLYRNKGDWQFEDVTAQAGVGGEDRWCGGVTFADIDNDHDLDLFVCAFNAPNLLYVNDGKGKFLEQAQTRGLGFVGASVMVAFADVDCDGDLDGYLVTARVALDKSHGLPKSAREALDRGTIRLGRNGEIFIPPAFQELFATMPKPNGRSELIIAGQRDRLFLNDGSGRFKEVGTSFGIEGREIGLAATWWDYNDDGFPDLYVSNDYKGPDRFYRNVKGVRFEEITTAALPSVPYASMGSDAADVNNDGRIDFFATDMAGSTRAREVMNYSDLARDIWFLQSASPRQYRRNMLYVNTGADRMWEAAQLAGLASTDWTWSPKFGDLDNDGWTDLFIANGMSRDFVNRDLANQAHVEGEHRWLNTPVLKERNFAFRNRGDLRFENVSRQWGLDLLSASYGAALGDLDRDGDLDLIVQNYNEALAVYQNREQSNRRVIVRLKGTASNRWGIGAKVTLRLGQMTQTQTLTLARGFMSANEPLLHFGGGAAGRIDELTVRWPNGRSQHFENIPTDQTIVITETDAAPASLLARTGPLFEQSSAITGVAHQETAHDDFSSQPLLPFQLSQRGPALACGDVDGDGRDDFFLGGARGFEGKLFLQQPHGAFARKPEAAFAADSQAEDIGAIFFDADGDHDLDLYVVSGGVEHPAGSEWLQDRLYLNDGKGDFTGAQKALPAEREAGSAVCAGDVDRDGDLDLFVGGHSVPGKYPEPARSFLLINEKGVFSPAPETQFSSAELARVTSAVWSDANDDGWVDLLAAQEWGPIVLLQNERGKLVNKTEAAGLSAWRGWWQSILPGDFDHDGDIDYLAGNLGLNTPYLASEDHPYTLYYGAWENPRELGILEGYYEGNRLFPLRGKTTLSDALPSLFSRYNTFAEFGGVTIPQALGDLLPASKKLEANCFQSGIFINVGRGKFDFKPLPRLAQIAPIFGVATADFDADGLADIVASQNFSGARPETGKFNGGTGIFLKGKGGANFEPILPGESGFLLAGDGRALATIDLDGNGTLDVLAAQNNAPLTRWTVNKSRASPRSGSPNNKAVTKQ